MVNLKLRGIGAAGNKGAIQVLNDGVLKKEDVLLINSVEKDIPAEYRDGAFIYNAIGGCGKEASMGKALALKALADDKLADVIDNLITEDKHTIYRPKISITQKDLEEIPDLKEIRKAIKYWEEMLQKAKTKQEQIFEFMKKGIKEMYLEDLYELKKKIK